MSRAESIFRHQLACEKMMQSDLKQNNNKKSEQRRKMKESDTFLYLFVASVNQP
jgi:hypothetical protein